MTVFLIIVSLILNVLALFSIVILFLRQNKLLQVEKQQRQALKEMEGLIDSYLLEMKDENERFIQRVKELQNEKQVHPHEVDVSLEPVIEQVEKREKNIHDSGDEHAFHIAAKLEKAVSLQAVKAYQQQVQKQHEPPIPSKAAEKNTKGSSLLEMRQDFTEEEKEKTRKADMLLRDSLLTQVMIMEKEGLTKEEMAQKLKKGKTEIELLLKFREKQRE